VSYSISKEDAIALTTQSLDSLLAIGDSEYPLIALQVISYGSSFFISQRYKKTLNQQNSGLFIINLN
jgi:hypothetical protein